MAATLLTISGCNPVGEDRMTLEVSVDGQILLLTQIKQANWKFDIKYIPKRKECLGWDLKPLLAKRAIVVAVLREYDGDFVLTQTSLSRVPRAPATHVFPLSLPFS